MSSAPFPEDEANPAEETSLPPDSEPLAAIDLGSNSFHMVIAAVEHGAVRVLQKIGEKVQLGAGLGADNRLDARAQQRGLMCLERFRQRLAGIATERVMIVGTNALREATNAAEFLTRAEAVIGYPISVISGREEARLIYLGVAHSLADDEGNRLVIDIGGGSTEFIIGQRFEPLALESLHLGCVAFRDRFFADGQFTTSNFERAVVEASREVLGIRNHYRSLGWQNAVGSSGTVKAVQNVLAHLGINRLTITAANLDALRSIVLEAGRVDALGSLGLRADRQSVFVPGLCILTAAFRVLKISEMEFCDGALREGLLYDILGRSSHEDVRLRTITSIQERCRVDRAQAGAVEATALRLWQQVATPWKIADNNSRQLLCWAAQLHELGRSVAHSSYHKHGAYLLEFADMPGFTRQTQQQLGLLVRCHRRKILPELFSAWPVAQRLRLLRLTVLLRLACVLQHARLQSLPETLDLRIQDNRITLSFGEQWLARHPYSSADLQAEADYLKRLDLHLACEDYPGH